MIRMNQLADDDDFPSKSLIQTAHLLADACGHRARPTIAILIERECSSILGAGDRQEMLDAFFADRAARQHRLLEGLGLSRTSTEPCIYSPGTWSLTTEWDGQRHVFVLSGIRSPSGAVVFVRMNARTLLRAASAWRAIANAAGLDASVKPPASEWRRFWDGFDYRSSFGERRTSPGLRRLLHRDFLDREEGMQS